MRLKKRIKLIIGAIVILCIICIIVSCLMYTRPWTVEQRYPYLDFTRCVEITCYCFPASGEPDQSFSVKSFSITSTDDGFYEMIDIIQKAVFKTRLRLLLPQETKMQTYSDGDYKWQVIFDFDAIDLPDGNIVSGEILCISNFFEDCSFTFNGKTVQCTVEQREQWENKIMDTISKYLVG